MDITEEAKEGFSKSLRRENIDRAKRIREEFLKEVDITEEAKEEFIYALTKKIIRMATEKFGNPIDVANEIHEEFLKGVDITEEAKKGFLKSLRSGNIDRAKEIREEFLKGVDITEEIKTTFLTSCLGNNSYDNTITIYQEFLKNTEWHPDQKDLIEEKAKKDVVFFLGQNEINKAREFIELFLSNSSIEKEIREAYFDRIKNDLLTEAMAISTNFAKEASFELSKDEFYEEFKICHMHIEHIQPVIDTITTGDFNTLLKKNSIRKNFRMSELALALKAGESLTDLQSNAKKISAKYRVQLFKDKTSNVIDYYEDKKWFFMLAKEFGQENIAQFIGLYNTSYLHIAGRNILTIYKASNLESKTFVGNILLQVADDTSDYDGMSSHDYLNVIIEGMDSDVQKVLTEASEYKDLEDMQKLVEEIKGSSPFASWKMLKKYYDLCQALKKKEALEKLSKLRKEGKEKQYEFFSKLAFHPNISMEKVLQLMENPAEFLDIKEIHASEAHRRKKPSNYLQFDHLDITGEDLRDALTEGDLDKLQFFRPFSAEYAIPQETLSKKDIIAILKKALGSKSENIPGTSKDPKKLFKKIDTKLKEYKTNLKNIYENSEMISDELKDELENLVFDPKIGIKDERKTEEFLVTIHAKSSPDGHVAGNDTACCMSFGSGKNNVYTFNLGCAIMTVQRKGGKGYRTIAQSVLTPDIDLGSNVGNLIETFEQDQEQEQKKKMKKLHEMIANDISRNSDIFITADNIEVTKNYFDNVNKDRYLEFIYRDFLGSYIEKMQEVMEKRMRFNKEKIVVGTGCADAMKTLKREENTYVPLIPPGYSDNLGSESYVLNLKSTANLSGVKKEERDFIKTENPQEKSEVSLDEGIRPLTAKDTVRVSYLEGKIYADNESLIQYIHRIGNELIAKDINNQRKGRPNLSLAAENKEGDLKGYVIAYEGVIDKEKTENDNRCIYISDLAVLEPGTLGGAKTAQRLLNSFAKLIEEHYLNPEKNNPIPIFAKAREQTSFKLAKNKLDRLGKKYGYTFRMEDREQYPEGEDTMHKILLIPEKIG